VYVTAETETPCLFGLLRPAVYLTPQAAEDPALAHILAHEYTHYRHGDQIWSLLRCLALALHWFDPLVWWAAFLSRRDGELACDEGALRTLGEGERREYGRALIRMTCERRADPFRAATTMTGSARGLRERIRLIAERPRTALLTLAAVVLIAALALGCTFTGARREEWDDERFVREAWPLAEKYGEANALELDLYRRSMFRLADGRTVEVYFPAAEGGQSVEVTFIRGEDGTWRVQEGSPKLNALALLDFVRSIPIEADLSLSQDGALTQASEWLHARIMEWNGGRPAGDGVYRENVNKIVKARITGLTPMGTGAAGLTEGQDLYLVEYRLLPEDQENIVLSPGMRTEILDGETWITEWGEEGQPYLLLDWKYREDMPLRQQPVWSLLEVTNTLEIFGVPDVSAFAEELAENYVSISLERYMAAHQPPFAAPSPEPTALPDAPVTVSCGGAAVIPYIAMRWAETWTGDGFLAGDGMAPDFVIREHAAEIPVLRRDGSVSLTYGAGAAPAGTVLRIYTADLELWKACGEEPEAELEALPPGTWWCSLGVVRTGRYIPEAERSESFGDDAIFCLEVPAEARQWKEELGSPGSFAVRASGSLEEIGARWAEAYAARYTGLSAENPLCCSEAAVRYCTLAAESLLPDPKEAYFRICLFLNARSPRDFASLCSPGDTPPDVDVFWPLEDPGYEGWLRMDFYVRLQNEGEDLWRSVELGVGGVSEWGWLDWTAPAGDVKYCMSCLLEGTVRMPEMVLRMLPHVDWSSFGDMYGSEGWEALRPVLLQGCRSTGFSNDPEDQSYRDTYVMLAALNAEDTAWFPELCEILRLQESADPERFARCLSLLGERGGRLLSGMEAAEHADSGLALLREVSGYAPKDWDGAVERGEFTALCEGIGRAALGDRQAQRDAYVMAAALRADGAYAEFLSTILQAQREADADAWGEALAAFSREDAELLRKLAELPGEGGE
jgi:hypothetical protein